MRRIAVCFLLAVMLLVVCSCERVNRQADLHTDIDSLSYAVGKLNGMDMKAYLLKQGVDTAYVDEVIRGISDGMTSVGDKKKFAYYFGVLQGLSMMENANHAVFRDDSTKTLSQRNVLAGLIDGINHRWGQIPGYKVKAYVDGKAESIAHQGLMAEYGGNKKQSEQFIAAKAKQTDIRKLRNGILYTVEKTGAGVIPNDTSKVVAYMRVTTADGQVISDSWKDDQPFSNRANQTIPGITEALVHMPTGSVWEVYIPWQQAYGQRQTNKVKPFSALVCRIMLISANK